MAEPDLAPHVHSRCYIGTRQMRKGGQNDGAGILCQDSLARVSHRVPHEFLMLPAVRHFYLEDFGA